MYSEIKSVQIIISLLKQNDISHIVISPGSRNTAFSNSVQDDPFFHCYSIVDERSAAYFALGIAETLNEGVCVSCTAATATANYLPAIKEAYERHIKLIALTADRDRYQMFHMEDQCIDQVDMYHGYVNKAVSIPIIRTDKDYWYSNRVVNEALFALTYPVPGPIQINYDMSYPISKIAEAPLSEIPTSRRIERYLTDFNWDETARVVDGYSRVLVLGGSDYIEGDILKKALVRFSQKIKGIVLLDNYANGFSQEGKYILNPKGLAEVLSPEEKKQLIPDLVITFGNVLYCSAKNLMMGFTSKSEHWQISPDGTINDGFHSLTKVFACRPEVFFEEIAQRLSGSNNEVYYSLWENRLEKLSEGVLPFSHFKVIKEFCKRIPEGSLLHTSVLNAIRLSNYSDMHSSITHFANIGADGIDGALSTFLGQASRHEGLAFLLIGDLSLLYDVNALPGKLPANVRILIINNFAGAEFHRNFGRQIETVDRYIAAGHETKIEQCIPMTDANYLSVTEETDLKEKLDAFISGGSKAIVLEVFTNAKTDGRTINSFWQSNTHVSFISKVKTIFKRVFKGIRRKI